MSYRIELGTRATDTFVELDGSDLLKPSFTLQHSQMSKWSFETHYDPSFSQYADIFAPIRVYWNDTVLFRGQTCRHKRQNGGPGGSATSKLEGHCRVFTTLKRDSPNEIVEYQNVSARDAIEDYWAEYTPYDATVHDQPLDDLPAMDQVELTDDHLTNIQKLHERANFLFSVDHRSPGLSVTSMSRGQVERDAAWQLDSRGENAASSVEYDDDRRDYANIVVVLGAYDEQIGGRLRYDAVNVHEIRRLRSLGCPAGKSCAVVVESDPDLETMDELQTAGETELSKRVEQRKTTGKLDIIPTWVAPGFAYEVDEFSEFSGGFGRDFGNDFGAGAEPTKLVLEKVSLNIGGTDASATLDFVDTYGYARDMATLRGLINRITDRL